MRKGCKIKCSSIGVILVVLGCGPSLSVAFRSGDQNPPFITKPRGNLMNFFSNMLQKHSERDPRPCPTLFPPLNQNTVFNHWGQYQRPVQRPDYERHFYNFGGQRDDPYSDEGGDYSSLDFSCQEPSISHNDAHEEADSKYAEKDDICKDKDYGIRWKGSPLEQANIEIEEVISKGGQPKWRSGKGDSREQNLKPPTPNEIAPKMIPNSNRRTGVDIHNCFPQVPQGRNDEKNDSQFKKPGDQYLVLVIKKDDFLGDARKTDSSIYDIIGDALNAKNATKLPPPSQESDESSRRPSPSTGSHSTSRTNLQPGIHSTQSSAIPTVLPTSTATRTPDEAISQGTDGPTKVTIFKNPKLPGSLQGNSQPKLYPTQFPARTVPDEIVSQSLDGTMKVRPFGSSTCDASNTLQSDIVSSGVPKEVKPSKPTMIPNSNSPSSTTPVAAITDEVLDSQSTHPESRLNTSMSNARPPENNTNDLAPTTVQAANSQSPDPIDNNSRNPVNMMCEESSQQTPKVGSSATPVIVNDSVNDPQRNTLTIVNDASSVRAKPTPNSLDSRQLNESMPKVGKETPTSKSIPTASQSRPAAIGNDIAPIVASSNAIPNPTSKPSEPEPTSTANNPKLAATESKEVPGNEKPLPTSENNSQSPISGSSPKVLANDARYNDRGPNDGIVGAAVGSQSTDSTLNPNILSKNDPILVNNTGPTLIAKSSPQSKVSETSSPSIGNRDAEATLNDQTPTNSHSSAFGPISGHSLHDLRHRVKGLHDLVHKLISTVNPSVNSNFGPTSNGTMVVSAMNPTMNGDDPSIEMTTHKPPPLVNSQSPNPAEENGKSPLNHSTSTVMSTTPSVLRSSQSVLNPRPVINSMPKRRTHHPADRKDSPTELPSKTNPTVNAAIPSSNESITTVKDFPPRVTKPENKPLVKPASRAVPSFNKPTIVNGDKTSDSRTPLSRNHNADKAPTKPSELMTPKLDPAHTTSHLLGSPLPTFNGSQQPMRPVHPKASANNEEAVQSDDDSIPDTFTEQIYEASSFTSTNTPIVTSTEEPRSQSEEPNVDQFLSFISWMRSKKSANHSTEVDPIDGSSDNLLATIDKENLAKWFSRKGKHGNNLNESQSAGDFDKSSEFNDLYHSFLEAKMHNVHNASSIVNASEPIGTPFSWWPRFKEEQDAINKTPTGTKSSSDDNVERSTHSSANTDHGDSEGAIHKFNDASPIVTDSESSWGSLGLWSKLRGYRNTLKDSSAATQSNSSVTYVESSPSTDTNRSSSVEAVREIDDGSRIADDLEPSKEHKSWFSRVRDRMKWRRTDVTEGVTDKDHNRTEIGFRDTSSTVNAAEPSTSKGSDGATSITNGLNGIHGDMVSSQSSNLHHNSTASTIKEEEDDKTMEIMITEPPAGWSSLLTDIQQAKEQHSTATLNETQHLGNITDTEPDDTSAKRHGHSHFFGSDFEVWSGENGGKLKP